MGKTSLGQAVTADSDGDGCKRISAAAAARITPISDQLRANARTAVARTLLRATLAALADIQAPANFGDACPRPLP